MDGRPSWLPAVNNSVLPIPPGRLLANIQSALPPKSISNRIKRLISNRFKHLEPGLPRANCPNNSSAHTMLLWTWSPTSSSNQPLLANGKVCLEWNDNPSPNCPYPDCRFEHHCYRCIFNPKVTDNRHKALFCPYKGKRCRDPILDAPTTSQRKSSH